MASEEKVEGMFEWSSLGELERKDLAPLPVAFNLNLKLPGTFNLQIRHLISHGHVTFKFIVMLPGRFYTLPFSLVCSKQLIGHCIMSCSTLWRDKIAPHGAEEQSKETW